jgi:hypothetical protein
VEDRGQVYASRMAVLMMKKDITIGGTGFLEEHLQKVLNHGYTIVKDVIVMY